MEFIDLKAQYLFIEDKIRARIDSVLSHGKFIMGPEVMELERKLAGYVGVEHCITCANGTDALQLALMAMKVGSGDAVFTTPFTFFATAEAVALCGATPIFVDVDEQTYNLSPKKLEIAINKVIDEANLCPKAIVAVDLFGLPANYPDIEEISSRYSLKLIEDGAQGFGGEINGQKACAFGDIATTSFFPAKPLGCYGDGGALFTNNEKIANKLRSLRVHGKGADKYDNIYVGLNSRLDTIQAAILLEKLSIFPDELVKRNEIAKCYHKLLSSDFVLPHVPKGYVSSWAQYTIRPKSGRARSVYVEALKNEGISSAIYYGKSLHRQPALEGICVNTELSNSEAIESEVFSLPMHPYLTDEEQIKIACVLKDVIL